MKEPLTIENEVYRGRCLLCFPIHIELTRQASLAFHRHVTVDGAYPVNYTERGRIPPRLAASRADTSTTIDSSVTFCNHGSQGDATTVQTQRPFPLQADGEGGDGGNTPYFVADDEDHSSEEDIVVRLYQMKQYPQSEEIQEWGCEGLWVHSWDDEVSSAIGRVGGIPKILDAMSRFPNNGYLQRCACEALQNIAATTSHSFYNRRMIVAYGGAALIVQAMIRHLQSLDIQLCGCAAIASLATCPELHDDILRAGGGHAIIHAARKYSDQEKIRFGALQALCLLRIDPTAYIPQAFAEK